MGKIIRNGIEFSGACEDATAINYNNSLSGLEAQTVQEAVDELNSSLEKLSKNNEIITELYSGSLNTTAIDIDFTDYNKIFIDAVYGAYHYTLELYTFLLTEEPKQYWTTSFFQQGDSNGSIAFRVTKSSIGVAFAMFNGGIPNTVTECTIYGIK